LLAALATGISRLRVGTKLTQHSLSLLYVIKQFIPEFKYDHQDEILSIQGIGYQCGKGQLAASKTEFNKKEDLHE
jgi:ArsR family metal-binding transcriptional regulator